MSATADYTAVLTALQKARAARGVTQDEAASLIGVSRAHFSKIECGHRQMTFIQVCLLADFLGLSVCVRSVTLGASE